MIEFAQKYKRLDKQIQISAV